MPVTFLPAAQVWLLCTFQLAGPAAQPAGHMDLHLKAHLSGCRCYTPSQAHMSARQLLSHIAAWEPTHVHAATRMVVIREAHDATPCFPL